MSENIVIVGVGGQGTLLGHPAALGSATADAGYDVEVSEVHGMTQRGGSVVTYVRYGKQVYAPVVRRGRRTRSWRLRNWKPTGGLNI